MAISSAISVPAVFAQTQNGTWLVTGTDVWSDPGAWLGGMSTNIANGQDGIADFSTLDITATPTTIHLDSARTIGELLFGDTNTSTAGTWLLDNNSNTADILTLSTSSGTPSITFNTATTATISAIIAGTQGFTLNGVSGGTSGDLILTGANTFTGGVTINSGSLMNTPAADLPTSNTVTITGSGQFYATTATQVYANAFAINNGVIHSGGSTTETYSGSFNLTGAATSNADGGSTNLFSGSIGGIGGLTIAGSGTTSLTGSNSYSGGTTISAGTLSIASDAALGATTASPNVTFSASSTLQAGSGYVTVGASRSISIATAASAITGTFNNNNNILTINGGISVGSDTASTPVTQTASFNTGTTQTSMIIVNGSISNATAGTSVSKIGNGILVLAGSNNFIAASTVNFGGSRGSGADLGIIRLTNSNALGTNAISLSSASFTNQDDAVVELAGGINIPNTATLVAGSKQQSDAILRNYSGSNTWSGNVLLNSIGGQGAIESADPNGTLTIAGSIASGAGNPTNRTIQFYGNGNGVISGSIANTVGGSGSVQIVIVGGTANSTWTFTGANSYNAGTPVLNLNGGTALLDNNAGGSFAATTNLTMSGGNLSIKGAAAGTSQTFAGTFTVGGNGTGGTGGGSVISINPNGGTTTLTLPNAWTRNAGGTVHFDLSAGTTSTAIVSSNPSSTTNGIFGYGTVNDGSGIGFATISSSKVARYTSASALTSTSNASTTNFSTSGSLNMSAASFSLNSLAIDANGGGTLDLGGASDVMTLTSGGLLMTNSGAGNYTIQNGQVGASAAELIVQQYGTGTLTINGKVSGGAGSLTKSGPGTLVLGSANTYTGTTTINSGVISEAGDNTGSTSGTPSAIVFNGGTLAITTGGFTMNRAIALDAAGGTINVASGQTLTSSGVIGAASGNIGGGAGTTGGSLTKTGTGQLIISNTNNSYIIGTFLQAGTLSIAGDGSLGATLQGAVQTPGNPDINIVFSGSSTLQANAAAVSLSGNRVSLIDTGVTATLDPQANTFTLAGAINSQSSSGGLSIGSGTSSGTVALTSATSSYTVPTTLNSGTLAVSFLANGGSLSSLGASSNAASNLSLATGATFSYTGASASTDRNFTFTGSSGQVTFNVSTAATRLAMSGATPATSVGLAKTGSGTLALTGTQVYTGSTTISGGTLLVDGSLASGSAVGFSGTGSAIGGTGTIGGSLTVSTGNTVSPGDPAVNNGNGLGVGTLTAGSLALNSGSALSFDLVGTTTGDQVNVGSVSNLTLSGGAFSIFNPGTATAFSTNGTYDLIGYGSGTLSGSNLSALTNGTLTIANGVAGKQYQFQNDAADREIQVVITTASAATWNVNGGGNWDGNGGNNWTPIGVPNSAGETVTFGSVLTGGTATVDLNTATSRTVGGVVFDNTNGTYTISSALSGSLILDNGSASASINVNNSPTGVSHTISAPMTLNSNLAITMANASMLTIGNISGTGKTVSISGVGSVIFTGNTLATGAVTVNTGTTLNFNTPSTVAVPAISGAGTVTLTQGTLDLETNLFSVRNLSIGTQATPAGMITDNSATAGTTTVTDAGAANLDFYGSINDGSSGRKLAFVKNNAGILGVHVNSTMSGGVTINQGIVQVYSSNALGANSNVITVSGTSNSQIALANGVTNSNNIVFTIPSPGTGLGALTTTTVSDSATFTGEIDVHANASAGGLIEGPTGSGPNGTPMLTLTGPIMADAGLTVLIRGGNVQLSGGGSYAQLDITGYGSSFNQGSGQASTGTTGTTTFGVTSIGALNGIATNALVSLSNNANGIAGFVTSTLDLNGYNQTVTGLINTQSNNANNASLVTSSSTSSASTLTLAPAAGATNLFENTTTLGSASITDSDSSHPLSIVLTGDPTGVQEFLSTGAVASGVTQGTFSYHGSVTLTSGTLAIDDIENGGSNSGLGASSNDPANLVFNGGTLNYLGTVSRTTDRGFTINSGKTATINVATAAANVTWQGSSPSGSGSFAKTGPGTLIVDTPASWAYTGNTTVSGGTLQVNGSVGTSGSGTISIASGAVLNGTGTVNGALNHNVAGAILSGGTHVLSGNTVTGSGGTLTLTNGLTLNGGTVRYYVDQTNSSAQDLINVGGSGLTVGASITPLDMELQNPLNPSPLTFQYALFDLPSTETTVANLSNLQITSSNGARTSFSAISDIAGGPTGRELVTTITVGAAHNLDWNSTLDANWDTTHTNWYDNTSASNNQAYYQGDNVNFVDNNTHPSPGGQLQTTISLNATVTPNSVTDSANSNNYTISGSGAIGGGASLTMNGTGTFTLETANTYTGTTTINAGNLDVGGSTAVGSVGSGAVSIGSSGTLIYTNTTVGSTFGPSSVSGGGNLTFATGSNVEVLQNADLTSFTGVLTVQSGRLSPRNATDPLSNNSNIVVNGGEIYFDVGNHSPGNMPITINGTGTGTAGANNDGALRAGGSTLSTLGGTVTLGSDSLIGLDGGATLFLSGASNGTVLAGAHALTLTGTGTFEIGGAVTGITSITAGTAPLLFAPSSSPNITISQPISGSASMTFNTQGAPSEGNLGTTILNGSLASYTGPMTINTGNLAVTAGGVGIFTWAPSGTNGITINGNNAVVGSLVLEPTSGNLPSLSVPITIAARQGTSLTVPAIENVNGNNTISGAITLVAGGSEYNFQSDAGSLTIQSNLSTAALPSNRDVNLMGAGNGTLSGGLTDNTTAPMTLLKSGNGTWTIGASSSLNGGLVLSDNGALKIASGTSVSFAGVQTIAGGLSTGTNDGLYVYSGSPHIDMGTGTGSTLKVADSSASLWAGSLLTIDNWTYGAGAAGDHFIVGITSSVSPSGIGLNPLQLAQIQFTDFQQGSQITTTATAARSVGEITPLIGDVNGDGHVNAADIVALEKALANTSLYITERINGTGGMTASPSGTFTASDALFDMDVNGDGHATGADLQALLTYLKNGGGSISNVPEPGSFLLLALGGLLVLLKNQFFARFNCRNEGPEGC